MGVVMMNIEPGAEVRAIAVEAPSTIKVFERLGIDYCCGGRKPLQEACKNAGLNITLVITQLMFAQKSVHPFSPKDWDHMPLAILCTHIVRQHHQFTHHELERLGQMLQKVAEKHGKMHPELVMIRSMFAELGAEMHLHMQKEEQVLFPYIEAIENSHNSGKDRPQPPFMAIEEPVNRMMLEHVEAGALLHQLRSLSNDFQPPKDACPTFRGVYQGLIEFEADLHLHIHLENNILFPRALELEKKMLQAA